MTTIVGLNGTPPAFPDTNSYEPNFTAPNYIDSNYTLSVGTENIIQEAGIWVDSVGSESTVRIGLYDMTGADAAGNGGSLLWEELVTFPVSASSQFVTISPGVEIASMPDNAPLAVAVTRRISGASLIMRRDTRNGDGFTMAAASNLQDPSVTNGTLPEHQRYAYVTLTASGPQVEVTGTLRPGSPITVSTVNFTSGFDQAQFSDGTNTISLTVDSQTQVTAPALSDNASYAAFGSGTLTLSNSSNSEVATTPLTFSQTDGWSLTTLAAGFGTTSEYITHYFSNPAAGQQIHFNPSQGGQTITVNTDGGATSTGEATATMWVTDPTDGVLETFSVTFGEDGAVVSVGRITRRALTRRNITRRSLTARP